MPRLAAAPLALLAAIAAASEDKCSGGALCPANVEHQANHEDVGLLQVGQKSGVEATQATSTPAPTPWEWEPGPYPGCSEQPDYWDCCESFNCYPGGHGADSETQAVQMNPGECKTHCNGSAYTTYLDQQCSCKKGVDIFTLDQCEKDATGYTTCMSMQMRYP